MEQCQEPAEPSKASSPEECHQPCLTGGSACAALVDFRLPLRWLRCEVCMVAKKTTILTEKTTFTPTIFCLYPTAIVQVSLSGMFRETVEEVIESCLLDILRACQDQQSPCKSDKGLCHNFLSFASVMALAEQEEYKYLYNDYIHPAKLLNAFRRFYDDGLFTDVTLQCASGANFRCHKAVLAACSNYFMVMFTSDMKEKAEGQVKLSGLSSTILESLVKYTYSSEIEITKGNVQSLLQAADLLQFISVKKACEQFLIRHLDIDNCIGMHSFAEYHNCSELEKESRRILLSRFEEVWKQEEFMEISKEKFQYLLSLKNLGIWTEEAGLDPIIKWIAYDVNNRIEDIYDLLSCLQIGLDKVCLRSAIFSHEKCNLNENTIKSLICDSRRTDPALISRRSTALMYVIGGYYWHTLCEVHAWDPVTNVWIQGTDMPDHTRESYAVTCLRSNIYVTGGYRTENTEALDDVWIYNCDENEWTRGCSMLKARYYHCAVTLHGCIYVLGGYRGDAPTNEAEFYDPLQLKWVPIANMIKGVGNATACVLNEVIYVIGGHYNGRYRCTYTKIQSYHSDTNEWEIIMTNPHPDYGLCSIPLENKLYLLGGKTPVIHCYDPERNEWSRKANMKERRMECGAAIMNGCIYVSGGYSSAKGSYLESVEKYDPECDTWEIVSSLPNAMRSHGCVSVYGVIEYPAL